MDSKWLDVNVYTPSSPEELQVSVDIRQDGTGHLQPVLVANWKIRDDGESVCCLVQRNGVSSIQDMLEKVVDEEN